MKILIFGASGSGTTTLANEIETRTDFKHLDVDEYYWEKTNPPYQIKILKTSTEFLEWANQYENPNFKGRSLKIHNYWIEMLNCKVLRLNGATELSKKVEIVLNEINIWHHN